MADGTTLFNGLKFWLSQKVPTRRTFVEYIVNNGGLVVPIERLADLLVVDHTRKNEVHPPESISYRFIELSVKNRRLEDVQNHKVATIDVAPRAGGPTGLLSSASRKTRTPFTSADDACLRNWVKANQQLSAKGKAIWQELELKNPRHTWQSWRDRWVKKLQYQIAPTTSAAETTQVTVQRSPTPEFRPPPPAATMPPTRSTMAPPTRPSSSTQEPRSVPRANMSRSNQSISQASTMPTERQDEAQLTAAPTSTKESYAQLRAQMAGQLPHRGNVSLQNSKSSSRDQVSQSQEPSASAPQRKIDQVSRKDLAEGSQSRPSSLPEKPVIRQSGTSFSIAASHPALDSQKYVSTLSEPPDSVQHVRKSLPILNTRTKPYSVSSASHEKRPVVDEEVSYASFAELIGASVSHGTVTAIHRGSSMIDEPNQYLVKGLSATHRPSEYSQQPVNGSTIDSISTMGRLDTQPRLQIDERTPIYGSTQARAPDATPTFIINQPAKRGRPLKEVVVRTSEDEREMRKREASRLSMRRWRAKKKASENRTENLGDQCPAGTINSCQANGRPSAEQSITANPVDSYPDLDEQIAIMCWSEILKSASNLGSVSIANQEDVHDAIYLLANGDRIHSMEDEDREARWHSMCLDSWQRGANEWQELYNQIVPIHKAKRAEFQALYRTRINLLGRQDNSQKTRAITPRGLTEAQASRSHVSNGQESTADTGRHSDPAGHPSSVPALALRQAPQPSPELGGEPRIRLFPATSTALTGSVFPDKHMSAEFGSPVLVVRNPRQTAGTPPDYLSPRIAQKGESQASPRKRALSPEVPESPQSPKAHFTNATKRQRLNPSTPPRATQEAELPETPDSDSDDDRNAVPPISGDSGLGSQVIYPALPSIADGQSSRQSLRLPSDPSSEPHVQASIDRQLWIEEASAEQADGVESQGVEIEDLAIADKTQDLKSTDAMGAKDATPSRDKKSKVQKLARKTKSPEVEEENLFVSDFSKSTSLEIPNEDERQAMKTKPKHSSRLAERAIAAVKYAGSGKTSHPTPSLQAQQSEAPGGWTGLRTSSRPKVDSDNESLPDLQTLLAAGNTRRADIRGKPGLEANVVQHNNRTDHEPESDPRSNQDEPEEAIDQSDLDGFSIATEWNNEEEWFDAWLRFSHPEQILDEGTLNRILHATRVMNATTLYLATATKAVRYYLKYNKLPASKEGYWTDEDDELLGQHRRHGRIMLMKKHGDIQALDDRKKYLKSIKR